MICYMKGGGLVHMMSQSLRFKLGGSDKSLPVEQYLPALMGRCHHSVTVRFLCHGWVTHPSKYRPVAVGTWFLV